MTMNPVSTFILAHLGELQMTWIRMVTERLPALHALDRAAMIDHLPEFLAGLAAWVDGDEQAAHRGFDTLAEAHALQRLGHGIPLEVLTSEYHLLRTTIQRALLVLPCTDEIRGLMLLVDEGLDVATAQAVHRYTSRRDEVRDRFIGILGHDLRNPLSSIVLAAGGITAVPCGSPKHASNASIILRSAERMQRMIADVMDFALAHLGEGIPAVPQACDMADNAREAAHELALAHPGRDIAVESTGDTTGAWDKDRVVQALSNLIGNAVQHGTDPIRILVRERDDRLAVLTRVTNRGRRIDAANLTRLFEPFSPALEHGQRRSGLGLGLYIVQRIAIAHGALCTVRSDDDETSFEIEWPRVPLDVIPDRA